MPRARDPRRDKAAEIYKKHKGNIPLAEIAAQLDVPETTVRAWKSKDKAAWGIRTNGSERSEKNTERSERSNRPKSRSNTAQSIDQKIMDTVEQNETLTEEQKLFCAFYVRSFNATQSYLKAYPNASYATANSNGPDLLVQTGIREEIQRLKKIKTESLMMTGEDVVEMHMRIAFADLTDYAEFRSVNKPMMHNGQPVMIEDPNDDEAPSKPLGYTTNEIRLKPSTEVDGMILTEVSQGRDGAKVKLADRHRSLDFLERYFGLNQRKDSEAEDTLDDYITAIEELEDE